MKKIIAFVLTFSLCISCTLLHTSAATPPMLYGDVDMNWEIDISDATKLQKSLAGLCELDYFETLVADYDHDGSISIFDATCIQKRIAKIEMPASYGGGIPTDVHFYSIFADHRSGMAVAGEPVSFTPIVTGSGEVLTYEFLIDDIIVQPRSENSTLTYTFDNKGVYKIEVRAYNKWGFYREYTIFHRVVNSIPDDQVAILALNYYEPGDGLHVFSNATGGSAPYQYCFKIEKYDYNYDEIVDLDFEDISAFNDYIVRYGNNDWQIVTNENNHTYLYRDYSDDSDCFIDMDMLYYCGRYVVSVQAKDSDNNVSEPETIPYLNELRAW